jgi:acetyltransferase-like isoleucine patch superfamily enzyme
MTALDRLYSYYPLLLTLAASLALAALAAWPSGWTIFLLIAVIYLLPPIFLRILLRWSAITIGVSKIDGRKFSPWLAAHHIQAFYDALPFLEALLRVIPGFYSMWLRLWGSRIGYGVEWSVNVSVLDRHLMDIGNRVVFSRQVELSAHVRRKTEGGSLVLVRPVHIGGYAFIGAGAQVGPGASIPSNANVPPLTIVDVNEVYGEGERHPSPDEAQFELVAGPAALAPPQLRGPS